ncbi:MULTISPECIES: carotenoid oxygenase family protein [unclassified Streptomyces]|uniref:carotenoid oxygenase family protein n=1 Tax=unclassified Streptomyces TaxID=2593676 RepID=UPI00168B90AB|nr:MULTISPECIES: carotenoid oxygenase family protein [unclassified Streptomyces]MBD3010405.1 carotenoid oxygenase family protein [Streptomyces sp. 5-10]
MSDRFLGRPAASASPADPATPNGPATPDGPARPDGLDARDITAAPIATVEPPHRVPAGIHGSWIPDLPDAATGP